MDLDCRLLNLRLILLVRVIARVIAHHGAHAAHGRSRQSQLVTAAHAPHASHGRRGLGVHATHGGNSCPRRSQRRRSPPAHWHTAAAAAAVVEKCFSEPQTSDKNYPGSVHRHVCRTRKLGGDHLRLVPACCGPGCVPGPGTGRRGPGLDTMASSSKKDYY